MGGEADTATVRVLCSEQGSWPPAWALLLFSSVTLAGHLPQTPAPRLLEWGVTLKEVLTSEALPSPAVPESCS